MAMHLEWEPLVYCCLPGVVVAIGMLGYAAYWLKRLDWRSTIVSHSSSAPHVSEELRDAVREINNLRELQEQEWRGIDITSPGTSPLPRDTRLYPRWHNH